MIFPDIKWNLRRAMISFLQGKIQNISEKYVIIDVSGVGYRVVLGEKILKSIAKIGDEVKIFTHFILNPRDGSVELYGFTTLEELNFFELLTTVSGVGPKSAQAILSNVDLQTLQLAILRGDDGYLKKVSGVGEKTAKRLILELKNKVIGVETGKDQSGGELSSQEEAVDALVSLGYSAYQAREVVKQVPDKAKTTEEKIQEALRMLGKR